MRPEDVGATARMVRSADDAWVLLLLDAAVLGGSSLFWIAWGHFFDDRFYDLTTGTSWEKNVEYIPSFERVTMTAVRLAGFFGVAVSILTGAIAATAFRRFERWSWYAMWTVPAIATLDFGMRAGYGALTAVSVAWDACVFGLALLGLVLPYRAFFPDNGDNGVESARA